MHAPNMCKAVVGGPKYLETLGTSSLHGTMFLTKLSLLLALAAALTDRTSCENTCSLGIVESIPENLTYPSGSPSHLSTYDAWTRLLAAAKETVDIASFYWTLRGRGSNSDSTDWQGENIFKALVDVSNCGVKTRIVQSPPTDQFLDFDSQALAEMKAAVVQNLNVSAFVGGGVLHTKLLVVDGRHFYVGSANMDWRSLTQVKELGLLGMDCPSLAGDAQKLFDVYWYLSSPGAHIPNPWPSQYTADTSLTHPAAISINGTPALAYWASSPTPFCATGRTHDLDALLHTIQSAQKFVYVAVMDYFPALIYEYPRKYWSQIDDALRSAAYSRGVSVRVMGSYWEHTSSDMLKFLQSLADMSSTGSFRGTIETRVFIVPQLANKVIPFTRVNHNKYMVTDKAAYIGTSNWSGDYFVYTGGLSLTITQSEQPSATTVQQELLQVFERDWNSPYAFNISSLPPY